MLKTVSSITNAIGALNYKGTWNASTNTPTLVSSVGVKGDYYQVSVAGSTAINGISNWGVGDVIAFNGTTWQRIEGGADLNGVNLSVSGTTTLSGLTASTALALNAGKDVVSVTNTGTGNNVLADGPTLTTPRVITAINDTNGNELFGVTATTSAVNEFTVANAATGNAPTLSATGSDTNIDINITPKGTGEVNLPKVDIDGGAIDGTAIGAVSASTGAFTTLSASSTTTLSNLTASTALALDANKNAVSVTNTGTGNNVLATDPSITNQTVTNYTESVVAIGTVGASHTIDLTNGTVQTATLTASTATTFTMPTATAGKSFVLLLKQAAATGNGTATFTGVKFNGSGTPVVTATAGRMDIFSFFADGTNWYGSVSQGYTP